MDTYSNMHLPWQPGHMHRLAAGCSLESANQADLAIVCAMIAIRQAHLHAYFVEQAPPRVTQHELVLEVHTVHCYFMRGDDEVVSSLSATLAEVKSWAVYNF